MAVYPLRVSLDPYRGHDPKKLEKRRKDRIIANAIEEYVNTRFAEYMTYGHSTFLLFNYYEIADAIDVDERTVSRLMFGIEGGSNGIIITSPNDKPPSY